MLALQIGLLKNAYMCLYMWDYWIAVLVVM